MSNGMMFPEAFRVSYPPWASKKGDDFGCFLIPFESVMLRVIAAPSDQKWQHVSVSVKHRCPNWREMSYIKDLFWEEEITVIQFHPKKSEYVNNHEHCLHLWRNREIEHALPPSIFVGIK